MTKIQILGIIFMSPLIIGLVWLFGYGLFNYPLLFLPIVIGLSFYIGVALFAFGDKLGGDR